MLGERVEGVGEVGGRGGWKGRGGWGGLKDHHRLSLGSMPAPGGYLRWGGLGLPYPKTTKKRLRLPVFFYPESGEIGGKGGWDPDGVVVKVLKKDGGTEERPLKPQPGIALKGRGSLIKVARDTCQRERKKNLWLFFEEKEEKTLP